MPTELKKSARCLLTPYIENVKMQKKIILIDLDIVSNTCSVSSDKPINSSPWFPIAWQISETTKVITKTTYRAFARFMVFNILIVFSSWARS